MLTIIFKTNTEPKQVLGKSEHKNHYIPIIFPNTGDTVILSVEGPVNDGHNLIPKEFIVTNRIIRYFIGNPNQEVIIMVKEVKIPTHA